MAKVSLVVFSLALLLSIQFVVGQKEDEAASPELVMSGFIVALHEGGVQGEQLKNIVTDPKFQSGVAKLVERFKSSVGDDSGSVDGTTSALADEVAASPESKVEIATEIASGLSRKMGKDGLVDLKEMAKAVQYDKSNGNTEKEKN
ncbi:hypothetical protein E1A91_A01G010400v1 [Gossypium mustelinum]|uniref:Uncharacterized protein n=2 Tax=Gossypium TaxID=3633 RepID=A0A2P5YU91_GOSBA|nr:hypothetical protein GOBAR_AA01429 [Gossypium barbadense]TYJ47733.1 hypothetical protein E1A91_A01G010400v1 [Gossypium mustelinum]